MWPFKRKKGSAQGNAAGEYPDEEIRRLAWDEFDKEARLGATRNLGRGLLGPLAMPGAAAGLLRRGSDPTDEHGQREGLRDDVEKA